MDMSFSEEQEMLRKTARDFLIDNCPKSFVREMEEDDTGYAPELWRKMAELGWMGLIIPENYGGIGGSFLDLAVLLEEMGRATLPGPFFSTVVLGGLTILSAGREEQKQEFLSRISEGELILTFALTEPEGECTAASINTKAIPDGDDYIINGTKLFVPDAHVADYIICAACTREDVIPEEGISLFLVDTRSLGIKNSLLKTMAKDKQCEVVFDGVRVPQRNLLGEKNKGWLYTEKVLPQIAVAKSMEMLGGAQQVLEMSINYAKERVQFDRLIGSFQAIQHHCSNIVIDVEGMRFLAYRTAWMISEGLPCSKEAFMTKAWVSDAYRRVVSLGTQIHGGVGIITEYDMQFYFRRAKTAEVFLGDADFYREKAAQELLRADLPGKGGDRERA